MKKSRRNFLIGATALGVGIAVPYAWWQTNKIRTSSKIVVVGGGAAGIAFVNKLKFYVDDAQITIIEPKNYHWYQPGQTLMLAGVYNSKDDVLEDFAQHIPANVTWIQDTVAAYEPDQNCVVTSSGKNIPYDFLIVASGVNLRYDLIEGLDFKEIGKTNIASIYASPQAGLDAHRLMMDFCKKGEGQGVFTRPHGPMKCAGAPLKATNLVEFFVNETGKRNHFSFDYFTAENFLFSVPDFDQKITSIWKEARHITPHLEHSIVGIDSAINTAYFKKPDKTIVAKQYDFLHLVPPMSANKPLRESTLAVSEQGPLHGYLDVDKFTLQHKRYPNVFGIGDVVGTPIGKTAASVKSQVPVVVDNLCSILRNETLKEKWTGYTSCPMILDVGHAMLWEFDYSMKPVTALPFHVVDPLAESRLSWLIEERFIRPVYDMMLRGYSPV